MILKNTLKNIKNGRVINTQVKTNISNIEGLKNINNLPEQNQSRTLLSISSQTNTLSRLFFF